MASVDGLDLVEEVIRIHNWTERFAKAAKDEYYRYLELKGRAMDFRTAKLAPSPTVALVWSVHRQWTLDYEMTCTRYGGFIHHFPLSMRDMALRKEAYAATLEAYERVFGQRPDEMCWEPFGKPSNGVSPPLEQVDPSETPAPEMDQVGLSEIELPVYLGGEAEGVPPKTPDPAPQPRKTPTGGTGKTTRKSTEKAMRMAGLVLRPLRPGETRTRGRPRRSDYVPIAELSAEDRAKVEARAAAASPTGPGGGDPAYAQTLLAARAAQGLGSSPLGPNSIPMKRGRGRPRKDGSWPIPRALQQQVQQQVRAQLQAQAEAQNAQILQSAQTAPTAQAAQNAQAPQPAQTPQAAQTAAAQTQEAAQSAPPVNSGAAEVAPAATQVAPAAPQVAPGAPQVASAVPQAAPAVPQAAPAASQAAPAAPQAVPGAPQVAPGAPHVAPTAPEISAPEGVAAAQPAANVTTGNAGENNATSQSLSRALDIPQIDQGGTAETGMMVDVGDAEQPNPTADGSAQPGIQNPGVASGLQAPVM